MADTQKFAQLQEFSLAGSGAVIGDTSIILKSMSDIDGSNVTMSAYFGSKGFGTLEPGNGTLEEQISFTGITQNANGTATLTGVSNVEFNAPYTETSGIAKTHAGSVVFIISNTAGYYNQFAAKGNDETITGVWTFPNDAGTPLIGASYVAPTLNNQVASKGYADSLTFSGAPDATTTQKGIVELATQAEVDAKTATGGTGASLVPTPALARSTLLSDYVADTGTADAYAITPSPAISAYATGQIFTFKAANTNTTTSTINVNAKGVKTIKKLNGSTNLGAGDIVAGQIVIVEYDGTNFQLLSPSAINAIPSIGSGQINEFLTTTDGSALTFGRPFDYQSFTGSGTWTKPTNLSGNEMVVIQAWGGGAGGSAATQDNSGGGGGGGGAFVQIIVRANDLGSTETVTIGAGGATGVAGGETSFGSKVTAYGGGVGVAGASSTSVAGGGGGGTLSIGSSGSSTTGGTGGDPGGATSGNGSGGYGGAGGGGGGAPGGASAFGGGGGGGVVGAGSGYAGGATISGGAGGGGGSFGGSSAGGGGASLYGGAGGAGGSNAVGNAGTAPGGGGGGGGRTSTTSRNGGAGARGEVRAWTIY